MLLLEVSIQQQHKNKIILNEIIKKFSKDEEIVEFYTKHKLWKYVNFNNLDIKLTQYGMIL